MNGPRTVNQNDQSATHIPGRTFSAAKYPAKSGVAEARIQASSVTGFDPGAASRPILRSATGMRPSEAGEPQLAQPFGDHALALRKRGLFVVPCVDDDGKAPKFEGWERKKLSPETVAKLACRYPNGNIGLVCGLSGIVAVDIDEPSLFDLMREWFGDTPLITHTPSGGFHFLYRKVGAVKSGTLRPSLAVDIKADGGLVVVPPSFNRASGVAYRFERGSWDDLKNLPPFRKDALAKLLHHKEPRSSPARRVSGNSVSEGERNSNLFYYLMATAPRIDGYDALLAEGRRFNGRMLQPPLSNAEVEKTARKVWEYEEDGRNWIGHGQGGVMVPAAVADDLLGRPHGEDALALLVKLKRSHGARSEPFAVCAKAMARDGVIAGWKDPRRYTRACKMLLVRGAIKPVSRACRDVQGRWKPAKYKLVKPGAINAPNITIHPLSALPPLI